MNTKNPLLIVIGLLLALMVGACASTQQPLPAGVLAGSATEWATDGTGLDAPLVWQGRSEFGDGDAETCKSLRMAADGQVEIATCGDSDEEVLIFPGQADLESPAWQRAIKAWVEFTYGEQSTGQRGSASRTVMSWWLGEVPGQPGACRHLLVLIYGYAYANVDPCDGGQVLSTTAGWLDTAELEAFDAWHYGRASLYLDNNYFEGAGVQEMSAAESAEMADWAAAVYDRIVAAHPGETETSAEQTALTWEGYTTMGSADGIETCMALALTNAGQATFGPCAGASETVALMPIQAQTWKQILSHFASMSWRTEGAQLLFEGAGRVEGEVWQRALANWAERIVAELSTGRVGAANHTAMSWWLGEAPGQAGACAHLVVLSHGYAYADVTPCSGGQALQHREGWLTSAEMAQFDGWLTGAAPTYVADNYLDGRGGQELDEAQIEEVGEWATQVYARLQTETVP